MSPPGLSRWNKCLAPTATRTRTLVSRPAAAFGGGGAKGGQIREELDACRGQTSPHGDKHRGDAYSLSYP